MNEISEEFMLVLTQQGIIAHCNCTHPWSQRTLNNSAAHNALQDLISVLFYWKETASTKDSVLSTHFMNHHKYAYQIGKGVTRTSSGWIYGGGGGGLEGFHNVGKLGTVCDIQCTL